MTEKILNTSFFIKREMGYGDFARGWTWSALSMDVRNSLEPGSSQVRPKCNCGINTLV
jgi:hypothetical protein